MHLRVRKLLEHEEQPARDPSLTRAEVTQRLNNLLEGLSGLLPTLAELFPNQSRVVAWIIRAVKSVLTGQQVNEQYS